MTHRVKCPGEGKETFLCHDACTGLRSRSIVGAIPCGRPVTGPNRLLPQTFINELLFHTQGRTRGTHAMDHTLQVLANLAVAVFVISSMLSMGLSLTMQQILEPLRNGRLVILALVLNFIVVPALAYGLAKTILANQQSLGTGMILLGTAAGAPFLPKLTQVAKGNLAFA